MDTIYSEIDGSHTFVKKIIMEHYSHISEEDQQKLEKSAVLIEELKGHGVKLEACSIASRLFKVDPKTYLPGVKPVGNTFVSLIGYQA